ncbi:MAG: metal ABC transporter ATP-binding protein [Patescibacteria group bacterium]
MPHLDQEQHKNHEYDTAPILEVRDLSVSFYKLEVLKGISFEVREGEIMAIIGPNGAGKSVLFRALMELIPFDGEVKWREDARIGYVPQRLFEKAELPLTVKEFFILKSKNLFFKDKQLVESIFHELKSVGLKPEILDQQLVNLSHGQFQRILIAWAILGHPNVLLFDEPTAGIDLVGEDTIYNLLYKLKKERKMTILIISHDLSVVYRYANNVLCINKERVCFGEPNKALTAEQIERLYGKSAFYHHEH